MSHTLLMQNTKVSNLDLGLYAFRQRLSLRKKPSSLKSSLDSASSMFHVKTECADLFPSMTCFLPPFSHQTKHTFYHSMKEKNSDTVSNSHPVKWRREVTCLISGYDLDALVNNIEHLWWGAQYPFMLLTWCTSSLDSYYRFRIWSMRSNK